MIGWRKVPAAISCISYFSGDIYTLSCYYYMNVLSIQWGEYISGTGIKKNVFVLFNSWLLLPDMNVLLLERNRYICNTYILGFCRIINKNKVVYNKNGSWYFTLEPLGYNKFTVVPWGWKKREGFVHTGRKNSRWRVVKWKVMPDKHWCMSIRLEYEILLCNFRNVFRSLIWV